MLVCKKFLLQNWQLMNKNALTRYKQEAKAFREARAIAHQTLETVAKDCRTSQSTICRFEQGKLINVLDYLTLVEYAPKRT